jgi:hypothetical protein
MDEIQVVVTPPRHLSGFDLIEQMVARRPVDPSQSQHKCTLAGTVQTRAA